VQLEPHGGEPLQWYSTKDSPPQIKKYEGPVDQASYTPLVKECVRAAMGLALPPLTGADSLHVLRTVFACYRAAETGHSQRVT
jgi:predicted dehydrogenase